MAGLTNGAWVAAGVVGSRLASGWLAKMIPASLSAGPQADLVRIGTKAAVGMALPMVLKSLKVIPANAATFIAVGGFAAVALDVFETYIAPNVPGLSDYELSGYESSGSPAGLGDDDESMDLLDSGGGMGGSSLYQGVYG
jgi:hypothetical protein